MHVTISSEGVVLVKRIKCERIPTIKADITCTSCYQMPNPCVQNCLLKMIENALSQKVFFKAVALCLSDLIDFVCFHWIVDSSIKLNTGNVYTLFSYVYVSIFQILFSYTHINYKRYILQKCTFLHFKGKMSLKFEFKTKMIKNLNQTQSTIAKHNDVWRVLPSA